VGQVRVLLAEQLAVRLGVLAQQRAPVPAVELLVTQPRRQCTRGSELRLRARGHRDVCVLEVLEDRRRARVAAAAPAPLATDGQAIGSERLLVAAPHQYGRMVL